MVAAEVPGRRALVLVEAVMVAAEVPREFKGQKGYEEHQQEQQQQQQPQQQQQHQQQQQQQLP